MLKIENLHAEVDNKAILKGLSLDVKPGEVHAIMGPNGAGKSTLASIVTGNEDFEVTQGSIELDGEDISELAPEERAHAGIFLSFQYPVEIPGVTVTNFIKTAINESRKARGLEEMPAKDMLKKIREKSALLEIDRKFLSRSLNEGFSGGEKKRNEIFQMAMLDPKLAILDETDSGLDIDALRIVANGVNKLKTLVAFSCICNCALKLGIRDVFSTFKSQVLGLENHSYKSRFMVTVDPPVTLMAPRFNCILVSRGVIGKLLVSAAGIK